jgi:hypothetical protein
MFSNRRPYYGLKLSIADFFREPVRYIKQSNTKESQLEKPYLIGEYSKMHLKLPEGKFESYRKEKLRPSGSFGPIGEGAQNITYWNMSHECGIISAFGRKGGGLGQIGSGFGGFIGYGFGLGCDDEADITFNAPYYTSDADWIWKFSVHSSEIDTKSIALIPIDSNTVTLAIVGEADGEFDICGEGTHVRTGKKLFCCHWVDVNCKELCECRNIGYTTQQMSVDEVQTLTVVDPVAGCTYDWNISSGGGSLSSPTGTSVDYTAPSSNAGCVNNPTITMSVKSSTCDTLEIAVNAWIPWDTAYRLTCPTDYSRCIWFGGQKRCVNETISYRCNGIVKPGCTSFDPAVCVPNTPCTDNSECTGCTVGTIDERSSSMKAGGCCPMELL